jgi:transposase
MILPGAGIRTREEEEIMRDIDGLLDKLSVKRVDHLPIVASFCRRIGLTDTVNRGVPTEMDVDVGTVVQAMVLDTLSGRSPLYRLEEFIESVDTELLLGKELPARSFNDTTLGRALDAIYEVGTEPLFSRIAFTAASRFAVDMRYVHFDTTSVNVWGAYDVYGRESEDDERLRIVNGHSKDKRPDLKQFLISMLCVQRTVPLLGGCENGNASDKRLNNTVLNRLSSYMATHGLKPGAFIYVADSAMVTPDSLAQVGDNLFITRLPFTYNEADRVVTEAVRENKWTHVGSLVKTPPSRNRTPAVYRVCEKDVTIGEEPYRAIVVHSSAHDKRRLKRIQRQLESSRQEAEERLKEVTDVTYFCRADAEAATERLSAQPSLFHSIEAEAVEQINYARGRPPKNGPRTIASITYRVKGTVVERTAEADQKRQEAGCFVLLSNVPSEGDLAHTGAEILAAYKDQHGIERNFGFLKDPLIVNDLFLKKPERVEVLGFILLVSLLVWSLIEHTLRDYVRTTDSELPGWDAKPTTRPTSFMMSTKFSGIQVINIEGYRRLAAPPDQTQIHYLAALGLAPKDLYLPPPPPSHGKKIDPQLPE